MKLTADQLAEIYPLATRERIDLFIDPLNVTMERYDIDTIERQCAFLAQVGWESAQLRYVRELASGQAYDTGDLAKRLGNTPEADGDGQKYRGRGLIELTGLANYTRASIALFGNKTELVENPWKLEQPMYAALVSGWFWQSHGLNELADTGDFTRITKIINGGFNGLNERKALWETAKSILI